MSQCQAKGRASAGKWKVNREKARRAVRHCTAHQVVEVMWKDGELICRDLGSETSLEPRSGPIQQMQEVHFQSQACRLGYSAL